MLSCRDVDDAKVPSFGLERDGSPKQSSNLETATQANPFCPTRKHTAAAMRPWSGDVRGTQKTNATTVGCGRERRKVSPDR